MSKKKKIFKGGLAYSTNPDMEADASSGEQESLPPEEQRLTIKLDTKQRRGKTVTLIEGFAGPKADLEALGKGLKNFCGAGGSVKDGQIIIQGDVREKVKRYLNKEGFYLNK